MSEGGTADGGRVVRMQFPVTALVHRPLLIKYIVDGRFKVCCRLTLPCCRAQHAAALASLPPQLHCIGRAELQDDGRGALAGGL